MLVVGCWLLVVGCSLPDSLVPWETLGTPVSEAEPRVCVNHQQVTGGSRGEWPFAPTKAFPGSAWEREDSAPLLPCSPAPLPLCSSAPLPLCPFLLSRSPDGITAAFPRFKGIGNYGVSPTFGQGDGNSSIKITGRNIIVLFQFTAVRFE